MRLDMDEWKVQVADHLKWIEAYARLCAVHAEQLVAMPGWDTKAAHYLRTCETVLREALPEIVKAREIMEGKPRAD